LTFSALVPEATVAVSGRVSLTSTADAVWIENETNGSVMRVEPETGKIVQNVGVSKDLCGAIVADFGSVFLPRCSASKISRVDAKSNAVGDAVDTPVVSGSRSLTSGVGSLWAITDSKGTVARIDPLTGATVAEIYTAEGAVVAAFGEGALWIASPKSGSLTRVNPHTNLIVEKIALADEPSEIAFGEGAVWTWNRRDGSVSRVDPKTNALVTTIRTAALGPEGRIAVLAGSVWISTSQLALTRVDPRTNSVAQVFEGVAQVRALTVAHGALWMAVSGKGILRFDPARIEATRALLSTKR
jgi:hypothetical protein